MYVCMYVCIKIIYACDYVYTYIYIYIYIPNIYIYTRRNYSWGLVLHASDINIYIYVYTHTSGCRDGFDAVATVYIHTYVYTYIHKYIQNIYTYIDTYIDTYKDSFHTLGILSVERTYMHACIKSHTHTCIPFLRA